MDLSLNCVFNTGFMRLLLNFVFNTAYVKTHKYPLQLNVKNVVPIENIKYYLSSTYRLLKAVIVYDKIEKT